jgi:hypothetical protein
VDAPEANGVAGACRELREYAAWAKAGWGCEGEGVELGVRA